MHSRATERLFDEGYRKILQLKSGSYSLTITYYLNVTKKVFNMLYVTDGAKCMCTGCPGVPGRLKASKARTVKRKRGNHATESDKKLYPPGFGMCFAIPAVPKKCSPKLTVWANLKHTVKSKGKKPLFYPNMIPCATGPGVVTLVSDK